MKYRCKQHLTIPDPIDHDENIVIQRKIMYQLRNITESRGLYGNNKDKEVLYQEFMEYMVAGITSRMIWNRSYLKQPVSNFISVSDEAFALLILENNWD
jgi:hypothetical protein